MHSDCVKAVTQSIGRQEPRSNYTAIGSGQPRQSFLSIAGPAANSCTCPDFGSQPDVYAQEETRGSIANLGSAFPLIGCWNREGDP